MAGLQTYQELEGNLKEYREQLQQVEELLLNDPENEEMNDMYNSLLEVIQLTVDLLKEAKEQFTETSHIQASVSVPTTTFTTGFSSVGHQAPQIVIPPQLNIPSILPASVAEQIRKAQQRAALLGQAPAIWAIGSKCQAMYAGDGEFYEATVESIENGKFVVVFEGYGNKETKDMQQVRPVPDASEIYKGVAAPKRKRVEEEPVVGEIPKWLELKPTDDEKTLARKKKLLKSYKSKIRFQEMDLQQKQKQNTWKSFLEGKGTKKKTGYFTGTKKESIFKVPEGISSKVGVVGSGKGMTDYQKRHRHEFDLDD